MNRNKERMDYRISKGANVRSDFTKDCLLKFGALDQKALEKKGVFRCRVCNITHPLVLKYHKGNVCIEKGKERGRLYAKAKFMPKSKNCEICKKSFTFENKGARAKTCSDACSQQLVRDRAAIWREKNREKLRLKNKPAYERRKARRTPEQYAEEKRLAAERGRKRLLELKKDPVAYAKHLAKEATWREENREYVNKAAREYYQKHKEKHSEKFKKEYRADPEKFKAYAKSRPGYKKGYTESNRKKKESGYLKQWYSGQRETLGNNYLKTLINQTTGLKHTDITKEMIINKRASLKLKRALAEKTGRSIMSFNSKEV